MLQLIRRNKQAHFGKGAYQQGHKQTNDDKGKGYGKGGGNGHGSGIRLHKQLTCACGIRFVPHRLNHTHCSLDCKKTSEDDDVTRATSSLVAMLLAKS